MTTSMTSEERQGFLAGPHVAIIAIEAGDGPPLAVPIWYLYEPGGEVQIHTGRDSLKHRLLERARRFTLTVQEEGLPYRYVSVEGPVTSVQPDPAIDQRRALARRYLGAEAGDRYVADTGGDGAGTVVVRMRPERWRTVDYGRR